MEDQLVVLVDPWQDKYDRLLEANEKLQKLNQTLEDKLLKLAEKNHAETSGLSEQIQDLTQRLVDARLYIHQLADENDRYRNDINCVIQLLQCKPSNFISPKIETLPEDLQRKILGMKNGVGSGGTRKEKKIIKVQVPTFPPTDIMYAVDKGKGKKNGDKDIVSAAIMAKVLQERENERKENRRNNCHCRYRVALPTTEKGSQTMPSCTISYSEFEFYNSEPEEEEDEEEDDNEQTSLRSHTSRSSISSSGAGGGVARTVPPKTTYFGPTRPDSLPPPRRPDSWILPGGGRPPGGAVPVRTTMTTTFDEIIKTSVEEEARLPTPLFGGTYRHRNQSSASQSSNTMRPHHHHHHQSPASSSNESEHFSNHVQHHHHHLHHYHSHHHQSPMLADPPNGHGDAHTSTTSLFTSPTSNSNDSTQTNCSDNGSTMTTNKTATTIHSNNNNHNNISGHCSNYRDTPPPSSLLQRSSSSSLSSPSSGLPPMSIPSSALIATDLNGDIMLTSSSSSSNNTCGNNAGSSSNAMSSACNTPSSSSTSGFHEPSSKILLNSVASAIHTVTPPLSSSSTCHSNNVVTVRKGALYTSHISNGSVTKTSSAGLTRSTSWNRERVDATAAVSNGGNGNNHGSSSSIGSSSSSVGGQGHLGLMTSLGNHWRSTILVHNPPRSHSTYEPLPQGDHYNEGGTETTFSTSLSPKPRRNNTSGLSPLGLIHSSASAASALSNNDLDCNSDSEQPLLQQPQETSQHHQYSSVSNTSHPSSYLFHAYHNPQQQPQQQTYLVGNGAGYTATSTISGNTIIAGKKRTFWARSSSTTSTETEI